VVLGKIQKQFEATITDRRSFRLGIPGPETVQGNESTSTDGSDSWRGIAVFRLMSRGFCVPVDRGGLPI